MCGPAQPITHPLPRGILGWLLHEDAGAACVIAGVECLIKLGRVPGRVRREREVEDRRRIGRSPIRGAPRDESDARRLDIGRDATDRGIEVR